MFVAVITLLSPFSQPPISPSHRPLGPLFHPYLEYTFPCAPELLGLRLDPPPDPLMLLVDLLLKDPATPSPSPGLSDPATLGIDPSFLLPEVAAMPWPDPALGRAHEADPRCLIGDVATWRESLMRERLDLRPPPHQSDDDAAATRHL